MCKKKKKPKIFKKPNSLEVKYVEELNASLVQEGMILLGIVSDVSDKIVNVSLPGSLRGVITIPNVSEFYTSLIQNMSSQSEVKNVFK